MIDPTGSLWNPGDFSQGISPFDAISDSLSGLAAITSVLDGTALETFLPSAFWPDGGIEWDWSSVSIEDVTFAVPFATPDNSYTPLPGIVVSGNGGQFIGSFAQTADGRPAMSVTDTINGNTQTYMETAPGIAGVVLDNGSYTGSFAVAAGSDGGALGAFLDPNAGLGQFGSFDIRDNATGAVVQDGIIVGGDGVDELRHAGEGGDTIVSRTRNATTGEWQTTVTTPLQQFNDATLVGGQIGTIFGSALSQAIPTDNVFEQVAAGSILAAIGHNFGQAIQAGLADNPPSMTEIAELTLVDFGADVLAAFRTQALGAVSGFLMGELAESLGFDGSGFGDQILRSTLGSATQTLAETVIGNIQSGAPDLFAGLTFNGTQAAAAGVNFAAGISSFIGGYIAREIVAPETLAGSIGAAIGGGLGSLIGVGLGSAALSAAATALAGTSVVIGSVGASLVTSLGLGGLMVASSSLVLGILLPGVGALLGTVVGTLIGDVISEGLEGWFDVHGAATSTSVLGIGRDVARVTSQTGSISEFAGPAHAVGTLSTEILNDILERVGGSNASLSNMSLIVNVANEQDGFLGTNSTRNDYVRVHEYDRYGNRVFEFQRDVQNTELEYRIGLLVLTAVERLQIAGGDLYLKRAIANSEADTLEGLIGDLKIAEDYTRYLANREIIDALIALDSDSAFAAGWIITLLRAEELGLDQINAVDFHGGLAGFAQTIDPLRPDLTRADIDVRLEAANDDVPWTDVRLAA